jgi:site-specific DNA-methyltransferase (adenine-specific)
MAMCEYAWTSFFDNAKLFECAPQGTAEEKRFHPTQKPVKLYSWILSRYAKDGDKILDTHVGSASSLIACQRAGLEYTGFEIDPVYYKNASERLETEKNQINMFELLRN